MMRNGEKKKCRNIFFKIYTFAIEKIMRKWHQKNSGTYFSKFIHCYRENNEKMVPKKKYRNILIAIVRMNIK